MKRLLIIVLLAFPAFASDLEVPLGARAPFKSRKAVHEIVLRDPSLLSVVVTDGAASLEGKKSGVTAVTVEYADGDLERMLVIVGDGTNSKGMSAEQAQTVKLDKSAKRASR